MFSPMLDVRPFLDLIPSRYQRDVLLRLCSFFTMTERKPKSLQVNLTSDLGTEEESK